MKTNSIKTIFGTDGIRNHVGSGMFTQNKLISFGQAFAQWAKKNYETKHPHILILHDTRSSCNWIKACLSTGLLSESATLYDAHTLPTPAALTLMNTRHLPLNIDCAIVISASHNPYQDNGIKIISNQGKLTSNDELHISQYFAHFTKNYSIDYESLGTTILLDTSEKTYCSEIVSHFHPNFLQGHTIVLDCAHGATYRTAPFIFKAVGAHVIELNTNPTGYNINKQCGALHPKNLQQAVLQNNATAGFAFDGDGDRVVAVNHHGELKNGDDILALLADHQAYAHNKTIIGTSMSNFGLEKHLANNKKQLLRTDVGDKYVFACMQKHNLSLGGEQSGHIIISDLLRTGDGTLVALRVMESIMQNNNYDMHSFTHYPQILLSIPITKKYDLMQPPFSRLIQETQNSIKNGRILVRYSGTEKILRIMVEAQEQEIAQSYASDLVKKFKELFKNCQTKGSYEIKQKHVAKIL